jgi:ABC-type multidrug transport system fused ATPase/permease subunit
MKVPAGMKIGLVGHSGCGKSTITNLILRYYNLNEGKISIDGTPLD